MIISCRSSQSFRSATSGNWNANSTWEQSFDGTTWTPATSTPTAASNTITVRSPHTVTVTANVDADQLTVDSGGTLSVNSSVAFTVANGTGTDLTANGIVATAGTITNNGQAQINNTLRIDQGGFPGGGTGTYAYDQTNGVLVFNNTTGPYVVNDVNFWPTTNGPQNVNVLGAGGITMNVARTVNLLFQYAAAVNNANNLTLNGTSQVNTGGFLSGSPNYGAASLLRYNTGGIYGRNGEWLQGLTGGAGYPFNVQLSNNTTLDLPNGVTGTFYQMGGALTIDTGSVLSMGALTQPFNVLGNITINGTLALSTASGGDIRIGGNWTRSGTFTPNGRAVSFNGTATQTITVTGAGTETFNYLVVDKPAGTLRLNTVPATQVTVNANAGNVLQLINAGNIDLAGNTLTLQNNGGSILVSGGARTIGDPANFAGNVTFTGSKSIVAASAGNTLLIGDNVAVNLSNAVDFGASVTTVNFRLNMFNGGSVSVNPPSYTSNSTLVYDVGMVGFRARGPEWSATSGPGYPHHVQLTNNSALDLGAGGVNTARQMSGNLGIENGSELSMAATPMTASLTVLGNVTIFDGGTLTLSTLGGGDLVAHSNFTNNGNFTHNNRAIFFMGGNTQIVQALSGVLTVPYVRINKTGGTVQLDSNLTTLGTDGGNSIEFAGATSTLTLNGRTLTLGALVAPAPAGSGLIGDASATLSLQDGGAPGAMGTLVFASGGQLLNNLTINRTGGAGSATLGSPLTVNAALNLAAGDILTGAFALTHNGTSTGTTDVVGNVRRTDLGGAARQFGNPNNQISFQVGTPPTEMTVNLAKSRPTGAGFGFPTAVNRTYTITPTGGSPIFTATLRLHYNDSDLSGTPAVGEEAALDLWRFNGANWARVPKTLADPLTGNWIESSAVTQFSPWTLSANPLAPTVAKLRSFSATNYGGVTVLEWRTRYELDNLGFNIYREQGGTRKLITPSLIAGSALLVGSKTALTAGNSYTWIDREASPAARYWVEDIDLDGKSRINGPVSPTAGSAGDAQAVRHQALLLTDLGAEAGNPRGTQRQWMASDAADAPPSHADDTKNAAISAGITPQLEALEQQRLLAAQASVKISVRGRGWRRVGRAELVAAGLSAAADPTRLQLFVGGVELPIYVNDAQWRQGAGAVEFYGEGLDRPATDTQTYWLIEGAFPGKRIPQARSNGGRPPRGAGQPGAPASLTATPAASSAASFDYTTERRDRTIYFSSLLNGEQENFFGRPVTPSGVTQTINVRDLDTASARPAQLNVALQGITTAAHQVRVLVNDVEAGTFDFEGRTRRETTFAIAPALLREGDNDVRMVALGGSSDTSLTEHIRLTYARLYRAEADALRVPVASGSPLNVGGFTSPNIRVMDITDPANVAELPVTVRAEEDSTFIASVPARSTNGAARTLYAFADTGAAAVEQVAVNEPSSWHTSEHRADLVVITHRSLRDSLAPLVAARTAEGLAVEVVDVEDIYDEWSYGTHSPLAVREFLAGAADNWQGAPRYVLLAGDGSFDPRNHLRRGAWDLVPAKLIDTTLMETASDGWLADFNDDGLPEMAVGRLPVRTAAEAARVVQKIASHQLDPTQTSAVLVSDRDGADGYDFEAASSTVEATLPDGLAVARVNRGARSAEEVRNEIVARVNAGPLVVNWMGHGSIDVWTGDGVLRAQDAATLANGARLPLFVMMTCLNGYYHDPSLESLAEALLKAEQGGALAVWTSTGMTEPDGQVLMNRELYRVLFGSESLRLGDAMQRARSATADADVRRTWVLIGDPTARIR